MSESYSGGWGPRSDRFLMGFLGLMAEGKTPQQARNIIANQLKQTPGAEDLIKFLAASPEGLEILKESEAAWAVYGVKVPWADMIPNSK